MPRVTAWLAPSDLHRELSALGVVAELQPAILQPRGQTSTRRTCHPGTFNANAASRSCFLLSRGGVSGF